MLAPRSRPRCGAGAPGCRCLWRRGRARAPGCCMNRRWRAMPMHRNGRLRCVAVVWLYIDTARAGTKTKCAQRGLRLRSAVGRARSLWLRTYRSCPVPVLVKGAPVPLSLPGCRSAQSCLRGERRSECGRWPFFLGGSQKIARPWNDGDGGWTVEDGHFPSCGKTAPWPAHASLACDARYGLKWSYARRGRRSS